MKELGLADAYTFKFETDNDLDSEERLDEDGTVLFRCARDRPYQQGKVLETEYDEGTYWVKLLCTAEQEEYNMNLSDPDIVPLLPCVLTTATTHHDIFYTSSPTSLSVT